MIIRPDLKKAIRVMDVSQGYALFGWVVGTDGPRIHVRFDGGGSMVTHDKRGLLEIPWDYKP